MNCTYCETPNSDEDHRCRRCGRRLGLQAVHAAPNPYPVATGAVAPRFDKLQAIGAEEARAALEQRPTMPPRQRSLFPQTVLRFDDYAETPVKPKPSRKPLARTRKPTARRRPRKLERLEQAGQTRFEFERPVPLVPPETESGVRSVRYCSEPVASPIHRLMAAAADLSMVIIGTGLFFAMFHFLGGPAAFVGLPIVVYGLAVAGIIAFYKGLWWLAGGDTPGMSWWHLRLLSFTGQPPTRAQRAKRFAGTCLSLAAAGLGLIWALGDEEKLGWHDHISKTFPSPTAG